VAGAAGGGKEGQIDDEMAAAPCPSPICSVAATVQGSDRRLSCRGEEVRGQAAGAGPGAVERRAVVARHWRLERVGEGEGEKARVAVQEEGG
jgi:hypothetical protein